MRKFDFRFSSLLDHRRFLEESSLNKVGLSTQALEIAKEQRIEALKWLEQALMKREELGRIPTASTDFLIHDKFVLGLKHQLAQKEKEIIKSERELEKSLRAYLFAKRRTRTIEILKEKAYQDFYGKARKLQQKELDEFVNTQKVRQTNGEDFEDHT